MARRHTGRAEVQRGLHPSYIGGLSFAIRTVCVRVNLITEFGCTT